MPRARRPRRPRRGRGDRATPTRSLAPAATLLRDGDGAEAPRFLRTTAPVDLVHEEHATIALPEGLYAVVIQREYVPPEISVVPFRRVVD